jgi:hypothetical protein
VNGTDDQSTNDQVRDSLRDLTRAICGQFEGAEIPNTPVSTVVTLPATAPYVAIDFDRKDLSGLRFSLTIGLLKLAEYDTVAAAIEKAPAFTEGVVIDAGGILQPPERINITRALVTNFVWRYLHEGELLEWDETRFAEAYEELLAEIASKSIVFHTTLPLSNLRMDVGALDFGDELKLQPASIEELERWLNPDRSLLAVSSGLPP